MKVRRYVAATVPEAMAQVKAELGLDAVILHTHSIRQGGFFGLFGRKMVEVTAAIEENLTPLHQSQAETADRPLVRSQLVRDAYRSNASTMSRGGASSPNQGSRAAEEPYAPGQLSDFLERFREHIGNEQDETVSESVISIPATAIEDRSTHSHEPEESLSDIRLELRQTRELLRQIIDQHEEPKPEQVAPDLPQAAYRYWQQLVTNDVDPDLASELLNGVLAECRSLDNQEIEELLRRRVLELMRQAVIEHRAVSGPEIVALVGPTGVGKTTTLAKLAAYAALVEKKKVGLITIDTYRIAAVEQLKTYAKILNLEVQVVFTPPELPEVLAQMADYDVVFLDTAGRSHRNAMQMSELKAFFDAGKPTRSYLVLSMTTKYSDMMEIIAQYEPLNLDTMIFTKLDETSTFGNLFNIIALLQKKIAYLANGQSVPEDIKEVDPESLTELILRKRNYA